MISILIPVFNYNIQPLVEELISQLKMEKVGWEILLSDDASNAGYLKKNQAFIEELNLTNVHYFTQEVNLGNAQNRNFLLSKSSQPWLLFLDADVLPVNNNFISIYLSEMKLDKTKLISGNIWHQEKDSYKNLLRWKYGKKFEQLNLNERTKNPQLTSRGANFAVKKEIANTVKFSVFKETYGFEDSCFFLKFKINEISVIENPVYHLGLEENKVFLEKTKRAIVNACFILQTDIDQAKKIKLLSFYIRVRVFKKILSYIYKVFHSQMETNLTSKKPSLFIFQVYKLLYLAKLDAVKK